LAELNLKIHRHEIPRDGATRLKGEACSVVEMIAEDLWAVKPTRTYLTKWSSPAPSRGGVVPLRGVSLRWVL
jgi:hypothetical protein